MPPLPSPDPAVPDIEPDDYSGFFNHFEGQPLSVIMEGWEFSGAGSMKEQVCGHYMRTRLGDFLEKFESDAPGIVELNDSLTITESYLTAVAAKLRKQDRDHSYVDETLRILRAVKALFNDTGAS